MKKIITILFIIMIFITLIQIGNTYALYKAEITGEFQNLLGVWKIKVNQTDLSSGNADMTFEITDEYLHFEESENVDANYIAPGSEGFFDILIDPSGTDVSVRYNVQITAAGKIKIGETDYDIPGGIPLEITGVEDTFIKIVDSEEVIDDETERINFIDLDTKTVSGVIPLSVIENGFSDRIRVSFKWVDSVDSDNLDTLLGNSELGTEYGFTTGDTTLDTALSDDTDSDTRPTIVIPVSLELIQYMGEEFDTQITTP